MEPLTVKFGEVFTLCRDEKQSTGYTFALTYLPPCVCLVRDEYFPPTEQVIGGIGTRRFTFLVLCAGEGEVSVNQVRLVAGRPEVLPQTPPPGETAGCCGGLKVGPHTFETPPTLLKLPLARCKTLPKFVSTPRWG